MGAGVDGIESRFDGRVIGRPENAACRDDSYRSHTWGRGAGNDLGAAATRLSRHWFTWSAAPQAKADSEDDANSDERWQASPGGAVEGTLKGGDFLHLTKPMRKTAAKTDIFDFLGKCFNIGGSKDPRTDGAHPGNHADSEGLERRRRECGREADAARV